MYTEKSKRLVLGEGETIGHKHVLESKKTMQFVRKSDSIALQLAALGVLTHDEHDRVVCTPGRYRRYNQVELNPMDNTVNQVFD